MRISIPGLDAAPINDSDTEHHRQFEQMHRDLPGAPGEEREAAQAAALGLSLEQFRRLRASLEALRGG
ncbi:hypothetical protein [Deinococcus sp.]|uniref:hypothetical protein n=1 Tax=Deinococcus sp. TaxID=47478 RepID=UPI0025F08D51|nr:hypothetical protein [Deinococcus sp.]